MPQHGLISSPEGDPHALDVSALHPTLARSVVSISHCDDWLPVSAGHIARDRHLHSMGTRY